MDHCGFLAGRLPDHLRYYCRRKRSKRVWLAGCRFLFWYFRGHPGYSPPRQSRGHCPAGYQTGSQENLPILRRDYLVGGCRLPLLRQRVGNALCQSIHRCVTSTPYRPEISARIRRREPRRVDGGAFGPPAAEQRQRQPGQPAMRIPSVYPGMQLVTLPVERRAAKGKRDVEES